MLGAGRAAWNRRSQQAENLENGGFCSPLLHATSNGHTLRAAMSEQAPSAHMALRGRRLLRFKCMAKTDCFSSPKSSKYINRTAACRHAAACRLRADAFSALSLVLYVPSYSPKQKHRCAVRGIRAPHDSAPPCTHCHSRSIRRTQLICVTCTRLS
jgi:hypothetical protein